MKKITLLFSLLCIAIAIAKAPTAVALTKNNATAKVIAKTTAVSGTNVVNLLPAPAANTECAGTSSEAQQGTSFTTGYNYTFHTTGTDVTITFELLDTDKEGVVAYLWQETPFSERAMTNTPGTLKFTTTISGLTIGSHSNYACKFAYAGGAAFTKYFTYTVGNNCDGGGTPDTEAPTNFTATTGAVTATSVELLLNGNDNSGAVIYDVSYDGGKTASISGNSGTQKSLVISGLTPETAYTFSVTAKDATGNTAANNPIVLHATTIKDTNTECAGTSSEAQQGTSFSTGYSYTFHTTGTDVTVTFELLDTDKEGVVAYLWQETPFSEMAMTNVPGTLKFTKTITGLTVGAKFNYACKFAYAGGSAFTKYFTYTVGNNCDGGGTPDTEAPTNFTASVGTVTATSVELLLNGNDNSGALVYEVTYDGGKTASISGNSGTQKPLVVSGLTPETAYTFSVTAKDPTGNTAANNPIVLNATTTTSTNTECAGTSSEIIDGNPLTLGYNYSFTTTGTDVTLTFELLDPKDGLVAYSFRQEPFLETPMTNAGGQKFTQTITGLTIGSPISYACKFAYAGGLSTTKYFTYTVGNECPLNNNRNDFSKSVSMYPNPARSILYIESNLPISKIEFYSMLGTRVKTLEATENTNAINIETLSKGIYMVRMYNENNEYAVKKLIVD